MAMTYRRPGNFTERSHQVIELAAAFAAECGHSAVSPLHIAVGLLREGQGVAATALQLHGLNLGSLESELAAELSKLPTSSQSEMQLSAEAQVLLEKASEASRELEHPYVGTEHFLLALARDSGGTARLLSRHGFTFEMAKARVLYILNADLAKPFVPPTGV